LRNTRRFWKGRTESPFACRPALQVRFRTSVAIFLLWLLSLGTGRCFAQRDDEKLGDILTQAQGAQQRGDFASAAKSYEELAKLRPDVAETWANLGLMRQFMKDYRGADQAFHQSLQKNARLYVPNLFLGLDLLRLHQPLAALPYLKGAVSLNGADEQGALGLGRAYSEIQDPINATRWFARASQISPSDPDAWYEQGVSYLKLQYDSVTQLRQYAPEGVHARTLVADALMVQGRIRDAIPIYERFKQQLHPSCLRSKLGLAYIQIGLLEKAKQEFQEDMNNQSGCLLAYVGSAKLALIADDPTEMVRELRTVNEREPNFFRNYVTEVWNGVAADERSHIVSELHKQVGAHDQIAAMVVASANSDVLPEPLTVDVEVQPSHNRSVSLANAEKLAAEGRYGKCAEILRRSKARQAGALAHLLEQCSFYAGDIREALETSNHAIQTAPRDLESLYWQAKSAQVLSASSFARMSAAAPDSPKAHLLMAELHRARDEFPAAADEYNQALKATPSTREETSARLGLAFVYIQDSEDDKALEQLKSALSSDPSNAEAHSLLGQILVRNHRYDEAIPHLLCALSAISPSTRPEVHSLLAKCYSARGNYQKALEELKPSLSADKIGSFHYQLYQIYQKLGDQKSAIEALQKSQQLRQDTARAEQQHRELTVPSK
jgi:tetratricopeptide (TPR) repeat protein